MGNVDTNPVHEMNEYRDNSALFTENLYDKTSSQLLEYVRLNSTNSFVYIEFNYKQIGQDEDWFQKLCSFLNQDKMRIKREILLQRIRGSDNSPFDPEDLDIINSFRTNPIEEYLVRDYFNFRVYRKLDKEIPYLIGVDVATGVNADNTAITVIDPYDLKPVAHLKTPLADEIQTSEILADIVTNFIPKSVLCIERNSIGSAVINILRKTKLVVNLYNNPDKIFVAEPDDKLDKKGRLIREAESRRYWGVLTKGDSRQLMMDILIIRVRENKSDFVCAEIIDDINNLIQKSNGKIEATSGQHDDSIMSYLIAMYVYKYGVKLSRYGIYRGMSKQKLERHANEKDDYKDIWENLPDELKSIFPKPQGDIIQSMGVPNNMDIPKDIADSIRNTGTDEEIFRAIREQEARRVNKKKIVINENNELSIEDDDQIKEMIKRSDNRGGFRDIPTSTFDICDLINS